MDGGVVTAHHGAVGTPQGPTAPVGGALVAVGALVVDGALAAPDLGPPGAPVDQDLRQVG